MSSVASATPLRFPTIGISITKIPSSPVQTEMKDDSMVPAL